MTRIFASGNFGGAGKSNLPDLRKRWELGQKETMVFPGQFHEVTAVSENFEPQTAVELGRPLYICDNYFGNELLDRRHVFTH